MKDTRPTLYIRGLDPATVSEMKAGAARRQITLGVYLTRLLALHQWCKEFSPLSIDVIDELHRLGLAPVED